MNPGLKARCWKASATSYRRLPAFKLLSGHARSAPVPSAPKLQVAGMSSIGRGHEVQAVACHLPFCGLPESLLR